MSCTIKPADIKRVKGLGFLNNKGTDLFNGRVVTGNGKITAQQSIAIANAAMKYGDGTVCYTTRMTVECPGIHYDNIDAFRKEINACGLDTGGTGPKVRPVVSCKGTTCQYGLLDTFDLAQKIHERFYVGYHSVVLPHKFKIAVGGCPNNCVKPDLNDLGIIGQSYPDYMTEKCRKCSKCQIVTSCPIQAAGLREGVLLVDEDACNHCGRCIGKCPFGVVNPGKQGYGIYIGGRWGKATAKGKMVDHFFQSENEVLEFVEKTILYFLENGNPGERFADTIHRLGFETVQKELLEGDILSRKEQLLAKK